MPLTQEERRWFFNYCLGQINYGVALLGTSESRAAAAGNLAFLEARNGGDRIFFKLAFSNVSSLGQRLRDEFAPSVPNGRLGDLGIPFGSQHANHTEPKLLEALANYLRQPGVSNNFDLLILASQLDCCTSCLKHTVRPLISLIELLHLRMPNRFIVVEINADRTRSSDEID